MHRSLLPAAVALSLLAAVPNQAAARMLDPGLKAHPLAEPVACRVIRERIERPNGSVVFRNRRECEPGFVTASVPECRMIRERVVRPNGAIVFRSVRRCD
jgi:hypothetical protein